MDHNVAKPDKYKERAATYKKKLRIALANLQTLAQRVAQYEYQLAAEREEDAAFDQPVRSRDFNQVIRGLEEDDMQLQINQILEENRMALRH